VPETGCAKAVIKRGVQIRMQSSVPLNFKIRVFGKDGNEDFLRLKQHDTAISIVTALAETRIRIVESPVF
jgi:hypothetical protein